MMMQFISQLDIEEPNMLIYRPLNSSINEKSQTIMMYLYILYLLCNTPLLKLYTVTVFNIGENEVFLKI